MKVILTESELKHAIRVYVAVKVGMAKQNVDVRLCLRARAGPYAVVTVLKPIPTLTESVTDQFGRLPDKENA